MEVSTPSRRRKGIGVQRGRSLANEELHCSYFQGDLALLEDYILLHIENGKQIDF